jgi:serine/threonine protein kinase
MSDPSPVLRERYVLGGQLGGGDGSVTYLAENLETGDRCVVKTLSVGEVVRGGGQTHSFDPDDFTKLIELFEREAKVLAHLDHSGIPRFIDLNRDDECGEDGELFRAGAMVRFPGGSYRLALDYP